MVSWTFSLQNYEILISVVSFKPLICGRVLWQPKMTNTGTNCPHLLGTEGIPGAVLSKLGQVGHPNLWTDKCKVLGLPIVHGIH